MTGTLATVVSWGMVGVGAYAALLVGVNGVALGRGLARRRLAGGLAVHGHATEALATNGRTMDTGGNKSRRRVGSRDSLAVARRVGSARRRAVAGRDARLFR